MPWTEVEYNGKTYKINILNYFQSLSTKEVVLAEDLPLEKRYENSYNIATEFAKCFGYARRKDSSEKAV